VGVNGGGPMGGGGGPPGPPGAPVMQDLHNGMGGMSLNNGPQPPIINQAANSQFYANQNQHQHPPNQMAPPGQPNTPQPADPAQDLSIKIHPQLFQTTTSLLPTNTSTQSTCKIPLGGIIRPFATPTPSSNSNDNDTTSAIPTIQPGPAGIIRCKRCRTYINPFATWFENGRRWRCNICTALNEVSASYFCHLDANQKRRDVDQRPELGKSVVEWIAPSEYMVRPPQAPSYFFVIDVSATAIQSGMLGGVSRAIRKSLDDLPGGDRTKVGFITFDTAVHYYSLRPGSNQAQMMVVGDLNELFVPAPDHLLADLKDSREAVEHLLDNLPTMFRLEDASPESCLGPALKAAFTITKSIGGRMSLFQSAPPTLGEGAVRMRDAPRILGTPDEVTLLRPEVSWYRDTALEFSKAQIAVDLYLFPTRYLDCASLAELPRLTAGFLQSYPLFDPRTDAAKLEGTVYRRLTQPTAFEAVLRIRCTKGMRISRFYGSFNIRGTDLLALPNCNEDSVYAFDLGYDDPNAAGVASGGGGTSLVSGGTVTIQSALLYTTDDGQRRIRVATQAVRLTSRPEELMASADAACVATLLAKRALMEGVKTNLDAARNRLIQTCVDVVRSAKEGGKGAFRAPPGAPLMDGDEGPSIPKNLRLLPLYVLSLLKHAAVRGGTDVHPDERMCARALLAASYVDETVRLIHPRLFAVHNLLMDAGGVGLPTEVDVGEDGEEKELDDGDGSVVGRERIRLPRPVGLSVDSLSSDGVYVLDNGVDTYVWVGRASDPAATMALFGVESLENANMMQIQLLTHGNDLATRLSTILQALHEDHELPSLPPTPPKILIVREGDAQMESRFFWNLVEDRAQFNGGTYTYPEFMQFVNHAQPGGILPPGPGGMQPGQGMPPGIGMATGYAPPPPPGVQPPGGNYMAPPSQHMPPNQGGPSSYAPPPPNNMGGPPGGPPPPPGQLGPRPPAPNAGGPPPPSTMNRSGPPGPPSGYGPPSGGGGPPPPPSGGYAQPGPPSGSYAQPGPPSGSYAQPGPPSGSYTQPGPPSGSYTQPGPPSGSYTQPGPPGGPPRSAPAPNPPGPPPHSGGYAPSGNGPPGPPPNTGGYVPAGNGPPGPPPNSGGYGGPQPPPQPYGGGPPGPPPHSGGYAGGSPPGGFAPAENGPPGPPPHNGGYGGPQPPQQQGVGAPPPPHGGQYY